MNSKVKHSLLPAKDIVWSHYTFLCQFVLILLTEMLHCSALPTTKWIHFDSFPNLKLRKADVTNIRLPMFAQYCVSLSNGPDIVLITLRKLTTIIQILWTSVSVECKEILYLRQYIPYMTAYVSGVLAHGNCILLWSDNTICTV